MRRAPLPAVLGSLVRTVLFAGLTLALTIPPVGGAAWGEDGHGDGDGTLGSPEWAWVLNQLGTGTSITSPSILTADEAYPSDWTGPVSGTFELVGVQPPAQMEQTPIQVDLAPGSGEAGPISGRVTVPASPGRWIIDVVRSTPAGEVSAQLQTLVDPAGDFTLDLTGAAPGSGPWGLRLLDSHAGYAQSGATWPAAAIYPDLQVEAFVVTDATYPVGSAPARVDGTFALAQSHPGAKIFRLVDSRTGDVLAEAAPQTGLVRSFDVQPGHALHARTYTYDQALALLTALSVGDQQNAARLGQGLLSLQLDEGSQRGAFVASAAALNPKSAPAELRTGIHGITTYALLRLLNELDPADPIRAEVEAAATWGVVWLLEQQVLEGAMAGLLTGGHGAFVNGAFDPEAALDWASTEHNLDAWHALNLASTTLAGGSAAAAQLAAERLDTAVMAQLWDPAVGGFLQGVSPSGPDPTRALDVDSWGAIYLDATGRHEQAEMALARATDLASSHGGLSGYAPHLVQSPLVWAEGTAGVALAEHRLGDVAGSVATLAGLGAPQPDGARAGASRDDPAVSMTTAPAVAAVTWVLLVEQAQAGQPSIWDHRPHAEE